MRVKTHLSVGGWGVHGGNTTVRVQPSPFEWFRLERKEKKEVTLVVTNKRTTTRTQKWFRPKLNYLQIKDIVQPWVMPDPLWKGHWRNEDEKMFRGMESNEVLLSRGNVVVNQWRRAASSERISTSSWMWWAYVKSKEPELKMLWSNRTRCWYSTHSTAVLDFFCLRRVDECRDLCSPRLPCYEEGQRSGGWQMRNESSSRRDRLGLLCGSIRCPWQFSQGKVRLHHAAGGLICEEGWSKKNAEENGGNRPEEVKPETPVKGWTQNWKQTFNKF